MEDHINYMDNNVNHRKHRYTNKNKLKHQLYINHKIENDVNPVGNQVFIFSNILYSIVIRYCIDSIIVNVY